MKRQALVDELLTAGAELQTVKRSGSVILKGESKRLKLSDGAKLTPAGKYYFKKQGVEWTGGFDPERPLKREGGKEFAWMLPKCLFNPRSLLSYCNRRGREKIQR